MVDRGNPSDMRRLTTGVLETMDICEERGDTPIDEDALCSHMSARDNLIRELVRSLGGYDPCPLECDSENQVYLRRTDTIEEFILGLKRDDINPLDL